MNKSFGLIFLMSASVAYCQDGLLTIPQSVSDTGNLASGYSDFIVQATFTVDTPTSTACNWIYGGEFDSTPFYSFNFGCTNRASTNVTISCTEDSSNNVVTNLTFLNAPTTTVNVNMRCTVSGSSVVDLVGQYSVTDCPISTSEGLPGNLNVTVTSGGGAVYNSTGEFMCGSGNLVDSSGISVSSNTTCQADATWTDQANRMCLTNTDDLSGGEIAAIVIVVPLGLVLLWFIASLIHPPIGCCLMEWFTNLSGKMPCCQEIPKNNGKISPAHNSDENVEMMSKPA